MNRKAISLFLAIGVVLGSIPWITRMGNSLEITAKAGVLYIAFMGAIISPTFYGINRREGNPIPVLIHVWVAAMILAGAMGWVLASGQWQLASDFALAMFPLWFSASVLITTFFMLVSKKSRRFFAYE